MRAAALKKAREAIRELGELVFRYVQVKRTMGPARKSPWLEADEGDQFAGVPHKPGIEGWGRNGRRGGADGSPRAARG